MRNKKIFVAFVAMISMILVIGCSKNNAGKDTEPVHSTPIFSGDTASEESSEDMIEDKMPDNDGQTIEIQGGGYELVEEASSSEPGKVVHDMGTITEKDRVTSISQNSKSDEDEKEKTEKSSKDEPLDSLKTGKITVYLDPGHGGDAACITEYDGQNYERSAGGAETGNFPRNSLGTTSGTAGGPFNECDTVYAIAEKIKNALEANGYAVIMSRDNVHSAGNGGGTAIGNWERGRRAAKCNAWVVLHADGGGGAGFHCVVHDSDPAFKSIICDSFISYMENIGRPIYTASGYNHGYSGNSSGTLQGPTQYINHGGNPNAMLYIEAGFMDNPEDLQYMISEQGQQDIAQGVVYALNKIFNVSNNDEYDGDAEGGYGGEE